DALMRGEAGAGPATAEVIAAFEKGTLPRLLARRAPAGPPGALRDRVLASYEREADEPSPTATSPSPLVVIGPAALGAPAAGTAAHRAATAARRSRRRFGAVTGIAASAAAAVGLLTTWASARGHGDGTIVPSARTDRTASVTGATGSADPAKAPGPNGVEHTIGTKPSRTHGEDPTTTEVSEPSQVAGAPSAPASPPATGGPRRDTPRSPSGPGTGTPPSTTPPSTTPPDGTTPPDPGTSGPSTPPPTVPPEQPEPSPAPSPGTPTPAPDGG
ncbi:hypothetical protein AB0J52_41660, partial [Spirillospora sp. NPDC049652]